MSQLTLFTLAPIIGIVLLAPITMLLIGKQLSVESVNLNFGRLFFVVFVGSLLAEFLGSSIHQYAPMVIFVIIVAYMTKNQLKTDWTKALAMTAGALAIQIVISYGVGYFLSSSLAG